MNVFDAWLSGKTKRKHTMQTLKEETTAEHTWGMLLLLLRYAPTARRRVYQAIILHDAGEAATADLPAHLCWSMPELKQAIEQREQEHAAACVATPQYPALALDLDPNEWGFLEVLDRAEFVLSCWREYKLGNSFAMQALLRGYHKVLSTAQGMTGPLAAAAALLQRDLEACIPLNTLGEVQPQ